MNTILPDVAVTEHDDTANQFVSILTLQVARVATRDAKVQDHPTIHEVKRDNSTFMLLALPTWGFTPTSRTVLRLLQHLGMLLCRTSRCSLIWVCV